MNKNEYLRKAAEAQEKADRTTDPEARAAWLKLVQGWLSMVGREPAETFEARAQELGTGQPVTDKLQ